jgi:hypothetical protein
MYSRAKERRAIQELQGSTALASRLSLASWFSFGVADRTRHARCRVRQARPMPLSVDRATA